MIRDNRRRATFILTLALMFLSFMVSAGFADEVYEKEISEAYTLFQQGKLEEAKQIYEEVIGKDFDNFKAHFSLGIIFQMQKKDEQALDHYRICTDIDPSFAPTYNNIGWIFFTRGEYNKAQLAYMQALEKDPRYLLAYNNLGIVFLTGGETGTAKFIFEKVLSLQPGNLMALNNLGLVYESGGNREEAKKKFNEVLMKDPGNMTARMNLARVFMAEGRWGTARKTYEQLEKELPNSPLTSFSLANYYYKTGDLKRSEKYLRKTLELQPSHYSAREILSGIYLTQKKYKESLYELLLLKKQAPDDPGVLLSLGMVYYYLNDNFSSMNYLSEALRRNPSSTTAMTYLGLIEEENSNYNRAFFYFYNSYLINSINPQIKQNLARVYIKIGKLQEGEVLVNDMLNKHADDPEALCLKSFILWKLNRKKDALSILQNVLRMNPDHSNACYYYGIFRFIEGNEKIGEYYLKIAVRKNWKILKEIKKHPRIYNKFKNSIK